MINYKWTISALDCAVAQDGLENVVKTVHWRYSGEDSNGNKAELYGAETVPNPNPEEFKAYETLTQEVVENWLVNILDVQAKQTLIEEKINKVVNPDVVRLKLPGTEEGTTNNPPLPA